MASPETPPETRARGPPRRPGSRFAGLVARPLQALALPRALFGATPPRQRVFRARRVAPSLFPFDGTPVAVPSSGDLQRSQFGLERSHLLRDGRDDPRRGVGAKRHGRHRRRSERRQRHAPDGSDGSGAVRRRRIGGRARGGAAREGGGEARLWGEARRCAAKGKGSPRGIDRCSVRRVRRIRVRRIRVRRDAKAAARSVDRTERVETTPRRERRVMARDGAPSYRRVRVSTVSACSIDRGRVDRVLFEEASSRSVGVASPLGGERDGGARSERSCSCSASASSVRVGDRPGDVPERVPEHAVLVPGAFPSRGFPSRADDDDARTVLRSGTGAALGAISRVVSSRSYDQPPGGSHPLEDHARGSRTPPRGAAASPPW